jgi:hypothetical protein
MEMGQLGKNWGGKRNAWIAGHLPKGQLIGFSEKILICSGYGRFLAQ